LFIKLFANRFELDISISKTNLFRKDVTLKIAIIDDTNCAIVFLRRMLAIAFDRFNKSLFNIDEDVFNKKRITKVLRVRLYSLEYDNYYASYFFHRDATIKARNSNILKTIIMLLD